MKHSFKFHEINTHGRAVEILIEVGKETIRRKKISALMSPSDEDLQEEIRCLAAAIHHAEDFLEADDYWKRRRDLDILIENQMKWERIELIAEQIGERIVSTTHHEDIIIGHDLTLDQITLALDITTKDMESGLHKVPLNYSPTQLAFWLDRARQEYKNLTVEDDYFGEMFEIARDNEWEYHLEYFRVFEETLTGEEDV